MLLLLAASRLITLPAAAAASLAQPITKLIRRSKMAEAAAAAAK
jgi:hypothetical protein